MTQITLQLPETTFALLRKDPDEMAGALREAAAVKWYELGLISQERAAEIAGLSRSAFITALARFQVCPLQYTPDEMAKWNWSVNARRGGSHESYLHRDEPSDRQLRLPFATGVFDANNPCDL